MRRRTLLAAGAALSAGGMSTGAIRAARAARAPGQLVMGLSAWPANISPWMNAGTVAQNVKLLLFRGLLGYGPDGALQGELAESWQQDSETTWTFRLRDAVFHTGQPVTADDVRYTIEQIAAERSTAYARGEMQRVAAIETPDARTVRLVLREPSAVVPQLFASYYNPIVAKGSMDKPGSLGVGAGPFTLADQERGVFLELRAFDRFYRPGLPKLKSVRMVAFPDEDLRVAALKSGDVDLIEYVPWSAMKGIEDDPRLRLVTTEGPFMHMYFNAKSPPFADARVRRAAALAVKRDEIVAAAFFGRARVLEGLPMTPGTPYFNEARSHGFAYDPAEARRLLAEAGYADGFDCKLLATTTYGMIKTTAEVVQSNLAAVGIRADLVLPDWATRITLGNRGQYDIAINGTTNESNDPDGISNYIATNLPPSYTRAYGLSLPKLDALLAEGRRTFDLERRRAVYAELEAYALEQVPIAGLAWRDQGYAMAAGVRGFTNMPGSLTFYSARTLETTEMA